MLTGAIIFSRLASQRLPGKALLDIDGRCLLGRVIDRSKLIKGIDRIIVATSSEKEDDSIALFSENEGVDIFRGSSEDVAGRALGACDEFKLKKFARICGDRPFFDPELVSNLIKIHNELNLDIATTTFPSSYPPGLSAEVVSTESLRHAILLINSQNDREHLTRYFYEHPSDFNIKNIENASPMNMEGLHLALDDTKDLERARWIASHLNKDDSSSAGMAEIISLARTWEGLF